MVTVINVASESGIIQTEGASLSLTNWHRRHCTMRKFARILNIGVFQPKKVPKYAKNYN